MPYNQISATVPKVQIPLLWPAYQSRLYSSSRYCYWCPLCWASTSCDFNKIWDLHAGKWHQDFIHLLSPFTVLSATPTGCSLCRLWFP